jgi:hypothetical protein
MKTILISCRYNGPWLRQFPNNHPVWGKYQFIFNQADVHYDYVVAFDDLHAPIKLTCPPENTIHIATEPPSVYQYSPEYLQQFSAIITHGESSLHPSPIFSQPGLTWFIGGNASGNGDAMTFSELNTVFDRPKTKLISVICSNKTITKDHVLRIEFVKKLKQFFGEKIDFFGRGFNEIDDKLDALQDYRFHVALENTSRKHYFTEKLSDPIIAGCFPIYYGCPNISDYLPEEAYAHIDIQNFEASVATIQNAINGNYDLVYRDALRQAKYQIMYHHNLYPMIVKAIDNLEVGMYGGKKIPYLVGNQIFPFHHPVYKVKKNSLNIRRQLSRLLPRRLKC